MDREGVRTEEGTFVHALLASDSERARGLMESLGDMPARGVFSGAFLVAVRRTFSPDVDVREITAYVRAAAARARVHGQRLGRREAEAAIRSGLGEIELVQAMSPEDLFDTQFVLLELMAEDLGLTDDELVEFVREAEDLAAAIVNAHRSPDPTS